MRHFKWRQDTNFWAAQAFMRLFRAFLPVREVALPANKRARLQQLRHKLDVIIHDRDILLERIKTAKGWERFDLLDEFEKRHADPQTWESRRPHREELQKSRQESECLQAIHQHASGDWAAAAEGYREYVKDHPESHSGYSYLGGALRKIGDLEGSLRAYREAARLSGDRPIPSGYALISIAEVLNALGQTDAAAAELRSLVSTASTQNELVVCRAFDILGDILMSMGDRKAAHQAWKQVIKCDPTRILAKKALEKISAAR